MAVFVFQPIIISLIMRVQYIHNGFYTYSNMRMPITTLYYNKKMAATMDPRARIRIYVRTWCSWRLPIWSSFMSVHRS